MSLLEQVQTSSTTTVHSLQSLKWRYPLKALSPQAIFPQPREQCEPGQDAPAQQEYAALWQQFLQALQAIPAAHRSQWPLWLDHFDTAWLSFTHAIPSATAFGSKPEVSLYDHSKTTAALAVALWRWHEAQGQTDGAAAQRLKERSDWDEQKFLLIQGDFFGIQDFIFADGSQTRRDAARLLRGRSFQVSRGITSVAFPLLGAQNGGLPADQSLEVMLHYLQHCSIPVEIYEYDPAAPDDVFDAFKAAFLSLPDAAIGQQSGLRADAVRRVREALGYPRLCQLAQLARVPGIGDKTLEKSFAFVSGLADAKLGDASVAQQAGFGF